MNPFSLPPNIKVLVVRRKIVERRLPLLKKTPKGSYDALPEKQGNQRRIDSDVEKKASSFSFRCARSRVCIVGGERRRDVVRLEEDDTKN